VDAGIMVFAGVSFIAETVALLNELLLSDNQASSLFRNPSKIMMMKNKFSLNSYLRCDQLIIT